MGFGVALIGYACLMLHEVGGGVFAAPILAYGFFLASRLNGNFLKAAVSALFLFPRGVLQVCSAFGFINIDELPTLNTVMNRCRNPTKSWRKSLPISWAARWKTEKILASCRMRGFCYLNSFFVLRNTDYPVFKPGLLCGKAGDVVFVRGAHLANGIAGRFPTQKA